MELDGYFLLKIAIITTCSLLFILQCYQEVEKYINGIESLASSVEHSDKLQFPTVVICLKEPFKMDRYALTQDEYRNWTYPLAEIIDTDRSIPNANHGLSVKEIATHYEGKCFVLQPPKNLTYPHYFFIGLKTNKSLDVYFIDKGQEPCIIYGSHCGKNVRNRRLTVKGISDMGSIIARLKVERRKYPER